MNETSVAFATETALPFDEAVERCRQALTGEGFGVLSEIDVQATLKKKLGAEIEPFLILGACHPPSAYKAVTAVPEVGVLLPCNVTVSVEQGKTVVRAMNPAPVMEILAHPALEEVADEVGSALQRVVESVAS